MKYALRRIAAVTILTVLTLTAAPLIAQEAGTFTFVGKMRSMEAPSTEYRNLGPIVVTSSSGGPFAVGQKFILKCRTFAENGLSVGYGRVHCLAEDSTNENDTLGISRRWMDVSQVRLLPGFGAFIEVEGSCTLDADQLRDGYVMVRAACDWAHGL